MFQHQCEDPRATVMGQHFQVIHKFFVSAKDEELQLQHDAWQASWNSLSYQEHPWRTVRGPFAACQAYILELGGRAPHFSQCTFPEGVFHFLTPSGYHQVLELMRLKCRASRCTGIAATSSGQGCEEGLDWTVPVAMLKKSKGLQQSACLSLWQGALRAHPAAVCLRCQKPATFLHVLHDCSCWLQHPPCPSSWAALKEEFPAPCFWQRGVLCRVGVFVRHDRLPAESLVFATDASGGPSKDPRLRLVAWSIVACRIQEGQVEVVGTVTGLLPGHQSVFRGEALAASRLCELTCGHVDLTVDCLAVKKRFLKNDEGRANNDVLTSLAILAQVTRLAVAEILFSLYGPLETAALKPPLDR